MYYKRISDLHPIGTPAGGTDWNHINPDTIPYSNSYYVFNKSDVTIDPYTILSSGTNAKEKHVAPSEATYVKQLKLNFNEKIWWKDEDSSLTYITGVAEEDPHYDPAAVSAELFVKSLWFEVAIAKDKNNVPTANYKNIHKYQSKRANVYRYIRDMKELSVTNINTKYLDAKSLIATTLHSTFITSKILNSTRFTANYGEISSFNFGTLNSTAISAKLGIVTEMSGNELYYVNGQFTYSTVTNITATDSNITTLNANKLLSPYGQITNITADYFESRDGRITNITATHNFNSTNSTISNITSTKISSTSASITNITAKDIVFNGDPSGLYLSEISAHEISCATANIEKAVMGVPLVAMYFIPIGTLSVGKIVKITGNYVELNDTGWTNDVTFDKIKYGHKSISYNPAAPTNGPTLLGVVVDEKTAGLVLNKALKIANPSAIPVAFFGFANKVPTS